MLKTNVLFIPFGDFDTASTRTRCYFFAKELKRNGISAEISEGTYFKYVRIHKILNSDIIYFQKTCNLMSYFSHFLAQKIKKITVYDFDDAIFLLPKKYPMAKIMIKKSNVVIVGNHFLLEYAKKLNTNTYLVPTPIDAELFNPMKVRRMKRVNNRVVIGWCGSGEQHLQNLKLLIKPLEKIGSKYDDVVFRLIGAMGSRKIRELFSKLRNIEIQIIDWIPPLQIPQEIVQFDIGVMPLDDEEWSKGKCALKALEYMSMGVATIASPIGENKHIIEHGFNGFLASTIDEWVTNLSRLIEDANLRREFGTRGRKTVKEKYSLRVVGKRLSSIMSSLCAGDLE